MYKQPKRPPHYGLWANMVGRCTCPTNAAFHLYGGRGIKVCERWKVYANFIADMGVRPGPEFSLERKDVNGDYEPGNVKWGTAEEQQNNRRNNVRITAYGEILTLAQWARKTGIYRKTIQWRIDVMRMPPEQALDTAPIHKRKVRKFYLDGKVVGTYESLTAASKSVGHSDTGNIWGAIMGKRNTAYGFKWEYVD